MKILYNLAILVAIALVSFYSCDKEEPIPEVDKNLLIKSAVNEKIAYEYYYDSRHRVEKIFEYDSIGNLRKQVQLKYNNRGQNISSIYMDAKGKLIEFHNHTYNADQLLALIEYFRSEMDSTAIINTIQLNDTIFESDTTYKFEKVDVLKKRVSFQYDSNKRVSGEYHYDIIEINDSTLSAVLSKYFEFNIDSKGNVEQVREYKRFEEIFEPQLIWVYEYEYDDKPNPYKDMPYIYNYFEIVDEDTLSEEQANEVKKRYTTDLVRNVTARSQCNIIRNTMKDKFNVINLANSYYSEYEYTASKFPITEKREFVSATGSATIYNFEYNTIRVKDQ